MRARGSRGVNKQLSSSRYIMMSCERALWALLVLALANIQSVHAEAAKCTSGDFAWANNGKGQDACQVANALIGKCGGDAFSMLPAGTSMYGGPGNSNECLCNLVEYNLLRVCAKCQNAADAWVEEFPEWSKNCASHDKVDFGPGAPDGTEIPSWARAGPVAGPWGLDALKSAAGPSNPPPPAEKKDPPPAASKQDSSQSAASSTADKQSDARTPPSSSPSSSTDSDTQSSTESRIAKDKPSDATANRAGSTESADQESTRSKATPPSYTRTHTPSNRPTSTSESEQREPTSGQKSGSGDEESSVDRSTGQGAQSTRRPKQGVSGTTSPVAGHTRLPLPVHQSSSDSSHSDSSSEDKSTQTSIASETDTASSNGHKSNDAVSNVDSTQLMTEGSSTSAGSSGDATSLPSAPVDGKTIGDKNGASHTGVKGVQHNSSNSTSAVSGAVYEYGGDPGVKTSTTDKPEHTQRTRVAIICGTLAGLLLFGVLGFKLFLCFRKRKDDDDDDYDDDASYVSKEADAFEGEKKSIVGCLPLYAARFELIELLQAQQERSPGDLLGRQSVWDRIQRSIMPKNRPQTPVPPLPPMPDLPALPMKQPLPTPGRAATPRIEGGAPPLPQVMPPQYPQQAPPPQQRRPKWANLRKSLNPFNRPSFIPPMPTPNLAAMRGLPVPKALRPGYKRHPGSPGMEVHAPGEEEVLGDQIQWRTHPGGPPVPPGYQGRAANGVEHQSWI